MCVLFTFVVCMLTIRRRKEGANYHRNRAKKGLFQTMDKLGGGGALKVRFKFKKTKQKKVL